MHRVQDLVRLHRMGTGCHEVARLLKMGPNVERSYRLALSAAGLLEGPVDELPDVAALKAVVEAALPAKPGRQEASTAEPWAEQIKRQVQDGVGPRAIYDALRLTEPGFTASYDAVKRLAGRLKAAKGVQPEDVAIPVETGPGQVAQVDFGEVPKLYDPRSGAVRRAWVFVLVLAYSRHLFCRIVFDQKIETWQRLHVEGFAAFGGVPHVVVPDNLKSAVLRAAYSPSDDVELNRSYRELAQHCGFKIDPAPPRAPKKKGKVERNVRYVKGSFFKAHKPADIDEANALLDRWVMEIAGQRIHGTTGRRPLEAFAEEQGALHPLPARPFMPVSWKQATVHRDCQIVFDGRPYPVPWRLVGSKVWIRATATTLDISHEDDRVISHQRGVKAPRELYDQCLPPHRHEQRNRSSSYWSERADKLHPDVGGYIREVFAQDDVLSLLRRVIAMVTHLEKFPVERARAACERARFYGNYTYPGLKQILLQGLDYEPLPTAVRPTHGALASPRYARTAEELFRARQIKLPLEVA